MSSGAVARQRKSWLGDLLDRPMANYYLLLGSTLILTVLGLVMVYSASSVDAYATQGSTYAIALRQLMWVVIGIPLMLCASRLKTPTFRRFAYPALLISIALLVLVLVPGLGVRVNGNQNWLALGGPFRFQPSEAAKLALVLWGADVLARKQKLLRQYRHLLVPLLPVAVVVIGLVLVGGDLGTSLVLMVIFAALLVFAGLPMRLFVILGAVLLIAVTSLLLTHGYRRARITSWLHPDSDPTGAGFQAVHSKFALASGGWWGLGLGASRQKWGSLPEAHTDFILAVIGEELGLFGTLCVLALFGTLVFAAYRIAVTTRDPFIRLAAGGMGTWVAVQATINVGAVVGVLPVTGIPLPLVSYGGSALLPLLVGLGMLMSFARSEATGGKRDSRGRVARTIDLDRGAATKKPVSSGSGARGR
jgi:cell division protein FtsW